MKVRWKSRWMTGASAKTADQKKTTGTSLPDSGAEREAEWVRQLPSLCQISGVMHNVLYVAHEPIHVVDATRSWLLNVLNGRI